MSTQQAASIVVNGQPLANAPLGPTSRGAEPPVGFAGWFSPDQEGVFLMRADGEPYAYASRAGAGVMVSAQRDDHDARTLPTLSAEHALELGVRSTKDSELLARSILRQAGMAPERAPSPASKLSGLLKIRGAAA